MIDPLGPDPNDPAASARKVGKVVSEFETSASSVPGSTAPLGPRVRHANYDSPEALTRPEGPTTQGKSAQMPAAEKIQAEPVQAKPAEPVKSAMPVTPSAVTPPPAKTAPPVSPAPPQKPIAGQAQKPVAESTALAHPIPPRPGKLQRAVGIAKTVLPLVGNLLPLLEGNVVGAASNLIANRGSDIDLKPLEQAIASLQSDQRALTFHTGEQKRAIRRLEDEFVTLQESVQKHAADQAELAEQVVKLAKRTSSFMRLVTILLVLSILATIALVIRIAYIIRF